MRYRTRKNSVWQWLENIKAKIRNFDIKPAEPIIADLLAQADLAYVHGELQVANKLLKRALNLNNTNHTSLLKSVDFCILMNKPKTALRLLKHALQHHPNCPLLHEQMGYVQSVLGNFRDSANAYERVLTLDPSSAFIPHFLDAVKLNNTKIAPQNYIVNLYDYYAPQFENSLLKKLAYKGHIELAEYLQSISTNHSFASVLDLGCGTGLLGQELLQRFQIKQLYGVDLSSEMLDLAVKKGIYQFLNKMDLIEYLATASHEFDLIAASDVLIYLGDLNPVFEHSYRLLKPGGFFAYTVEKLNRGDYKLAINGRYQHSLTYLESLYKRYHFSKMYSQTIDLRMESGNMVSGYLVLLQK